MTDPIVTVTQGEMRGVVLQSVLGPSYIAFKGVPFAVPPVGELRFQDPRPAEPWSGVRDASKSFECCIQRDHVPPFSLRGTEDCLYLNVFTNSLAGRKPVMFWIHGGAFTSGTGSDTAFGPDYLVPKDVVLVSTNYRLGAFGFLNLGHKEAPGNYAVKDLLMALKWTKENAVNFGGDPNSITIFGISAGGALVDALCRSPAAKGLFQKAILQSGCLNCTWATNDRHVQFGFKLASLLGFESKDPTEVVQFLRTVPAEKIVDTSTQLIHGEESWLHNLEFGVTIGDRSEDPVLPGPVDKLLENQFDIPIMIGHTSHEYLMFLHDVSKEKLAILDRHVTKRFEYIARLEGIRDVDGFVKNVKDKYFDGKPLAEDKLDRYVEVNSDIYFKIPNKNLVNSRVKGKSAPTYFYQFSYVGDEKSSSDFLNLPRIMRGASHVAEVPYLFYLTQYKAKNPDPPAPGTKDRVTLERMTRLWTNFAKTGNPTPSLDEYIDVVWKPASKDECLCMQIGDDLTLSPAEPDIRSCI